MEITGELPDGAEKVLTPKALELIVELNRKFNGTRLERLEARKERQAQIAAGADLDFLPETAEIRNDPSWQVAPPAPGLEDRRVEMTGPTYKKMTINALNSGAKVWLADQEDANNPQWDSVIGGELNLLDSLNREIDFTSPEG
ncbi:MAG: malate synthase A, partial [Brevibacterium sp.]|nr:malate synthase A [Brevibacterium sp.]